MAMNLPAAIKSANEILALARQHERKKFIASSSVMLTVEMVKISNAINAYQGEPTRETRTLEDIFEQCRILEDQCRTAARRRMMVYGLLYKRGHIVKNWQMRMFVLDGGKLSYYQLGETEAKGHLMLHLVRKVSMVQLPMKRNCFKVETTSKEYIMQAPDEASLQIWMDALRPYKEGWLTKQGAVVKNWKRRWFVLYKTQLAYFDGTSGGARRDRKGFILLKEVLPGSVHPVDETMFNGKMNVFQIETKERTFYLQGDTVDAMDDWLDSILRSIQTRGRMQSVSAALEAGEMDSLEGGEVSRDSTMLGPDQASQAALDKIQAEREEFDEEDRLEPAPEGAPPPVGGGGRVRDGAANRGRRGHHTGGHRAGPCPAAPAGQERAGWPGTRRRRRARHAQRASGGAGAPASGAGAGAEEPRARARDERAEEGAGAEAEGAGAGAAHDRARGRRRR